uniref:Uncharacterized protein n=1 Tax=Pristionchus pacificus TaxID=54126 RepID=A0A2A6D2K3_PRIPA|eukprot:PDM84566.1 hypothetical protein PRIPAC_33589 [Pristionchus pacificus]
MRWVGNRRSFETSWPIDDTRVDADPLEERQRLMARRAALDAKNSCIEQAVHAKNKNTMHCHCRRKATKKHNQA